MANDRSIPIDRVKRAETLLEGVCNFLGYLLKRTQNGCVQDNRTAIRTPSGLALKLGDGCDWRGYARINFGHGVIENNKGTFRSL